MIEEGKGGRDGSGPKKTSLKRKKTNRCKGKKQNHQSKPKKKKKKTKKKTNTHQTQN